MRRGTSRDSGRSNIGEYERGPWLDRYLELHPAFVSRHLQIAEGLTLDKQPLREVYKEWMLANPEPFGDPDMNVDMTDLHNLYLHLIKGQGVDEDGSTFHGVGLRPSSG